MPSSNPLGYIRDQIMYAAVNLTRPQSAKPLSTLEKMGHYLIIVADKMCSISSTYREKKDLLERRIEVINKSTTPQTDNPPSTSLKGRAVDVKSHFPPPPMTPTPTTDVKPSSTQEEATAKDSGPLKPSSPPPAQQKPWWRSWRKVGAAGLAGAAVFGAALKASQSTPSDTTALIPTDKPTPPPTVLPPSFSPTTTPTLHEQPTPLNVDPTTPGPLTQQLIDSLKDTSIRAPTSHVSTAHDTHNVSQQVLGSEKSSAPTAEGSGSSWWQVPFFLLTAGVIIKNVMSRLRRSKAQPNIEPPYVCSSPIPSILSNAKPLWPPKGTDAEIANRVVLPGQDRLVPEDDAYTSCLIGTTHLDRDTRTGEATKTTRILDAARSRRVTDPHGNVTAVITLADGFYGHREDQVNYDINTSFISQQACRYLDEQMMQYDAPQALQENYKTIIKKTDLFLRSLTDDGATNVSGVRVFQSDNEITIAGIGLGNQRWFLTNAATGQTWQLNNLKGIDDCSGKGFVGNGGWPGYQNGEEDFFIQTFPNIPPEDIVIWGGTDGAWQNLEKNPDNEFLVNCNALQDVLAGSKDSIGLRKKLQSHITERFTKATARQLAEWGYEERNNVAKTAFHDQLAKALNLDEFQKDTAATLSEEYKAAWNEANKFRKNWAIVRTPIHELPAEEAAKYQQLLQRCERADQAIKKDSISMNLAARAAIAQVSDKMEYRRFLDELKNLQELLTNDPLIRKESKVKIQHFLQEQINQLERLNTLLWESDWKPIEDKAMDDFALIVMSPFKENNLQERQASAQTNFSRLEAEIADLYGTSSQTNSCSALTPAIREYGNTLLKFTNNWNNAIKEKIDPTPKEQEKIERQPIDIEELEQIQSVFNVAISTAEKEIEKVRAELEKQGVNVEQWDEEFKKQKQSFFQTCKDALNSYRKLDPKEVNSSFKTYQSAIWEIQKTTVNAPNTLQNGLDEAQSKISVPSPLGGALRQLGQANLQPQEAIKELQRLRDQYAKDPQESKNLQLIGIQIGKLEELIKYQQQLVKPAPEEAKGASQASQGSGFQRSVREMPPESKTRQESKEERSEEVRLSPRRRRHIHPSESSSAASSSTAGTVVGLVRGVAAATGADQAIDVQAPWYKAMQRVALKNLEAAYKDISSQIKWWDPAQDSWRNDNDGSIRLKHTKGRKEKLEATTLVTNILDGTKLQLTLDTARGKDEADPPIEAKEPPIEVIWRKPEEIVNYATEHLLNALPPFLSISDEHVLSQMRKAPDKGMVTFGKGELYELTVDCTTTTILAIKNEIADKLNNLTRAKYTAEDVTLTLNNQELPGLDLVIGLLIADNDSGSSPIDFKDLKISIKEKR